MTPRLGKLVTLRATEVWGNEAHVFTPWLAENLDLLADALQLDELELKGREVAIGDFRLDLLAEDREGNPVLIENQFGATDHRHLGQLITYVASQSNRATVVWVAEKFKEDHRAAIDWLNASTIEGFDFFAVEIEALKIGNSDPAPYFNVVAKPNAWTRNIGAVTRNAGDLAEGDNLRVAYWASFAEFLRNRTRSFAIRRANKDHWFTFPIGRSGIDISATFNTKMRRIGVELYLRNDPQKVGFKHLLQDRSIIEREFGESLDWQELPNKKASRIAIFKTGIEPQDAACYQDLHEWMLARMETYRRVFGARVRTLPMTADEQEGDLSNTDGPE